ncbi:MAG: MgtC/SapB family protein, partial [Bacteroidales bacterium]|nr:MgtC/SapB family protein [Bacteroidales bacterium]
MSLALQLVIRILAAALLGAAIGYEREIRTKSAGVRTHVLVALGAALFMIISQYGFGSADKFDAARVAAGVVTGIGFLGGGIII